MKLKIFLSTIIMAFMYGTLGTYTITNQTDYPAHMSVTLVCEHTDGKYQESTIELDFKPKESKYVPDSCRLESASAILDAHGKKLSTGVFNGNFVSGKVSSGILPSWQISADLEGQYTGETPYIRMAA